MNALTPLDELRQQQGWPTPNSMRKAADGIDSLSIPKYGDILRWVADLCDEPSALGYEVRPIEQASVRPASPDPAEAADEMGGHFGPCCYGSNHQAAEAADRDDD